MFTLLHTSGRHVSKLGRLVTSDVSLGPPSSVDDKCSSSTSVRPVRPCVSAVGGAIALGRYYFHLHTEVVEAMELGGIVARDEKANLRKIAKKKKIEKKG